MSEPASGTGELETLAGSVDRALGELEGLDRPARERALAVKAAIEAFHRAGLTKIVRTLKDDARGKELLLELAREPEVYALFAMHGLVRADLTTRVARVLDMVRPYMQSHGGDVELVEVRERTAVVRLSGACHGCSMSAATLRNSVEEALRTHVPEIETVEQAPAEPAAGFVPLASLGKGAAHGWVDGPSVAEVIEGRPYRLDVGESSVVLLRFGETFYAFRNACAHQGLPLDGGMLDLEEGVLTCPWHGFRFDARTGECLTAPEAQLEPLPLRVESGILRVRPQ